MGFLVICSGVVLLQLSKSAKDVPDAAVFKGDLDQVRTVAEQEEPESEPKADAIRGTAAIIRRLSQSRQKLEVAEAKRVHEERMRDQMEPIGENEQVEWDGLRRRKTVIDGPGSITRRKTLHPPLGMTHFPDEDESSDHDESRPASTDVHGGSGVFHGSFFDSFRRRNQRKDSLPAHSRTVHNKPTSSSRTELPQRPLTEVIVSPNKDGGEDTAYHPPTSSGSMEMGHVYGLPGGLQRSPSATERSHGRPIVWAEGVATDRPSTSRGNSSNNNLAPPTPPPHSNTNKRQFSFQNPFHRNRGGTVTSTTSTDGTSEAERPRHQRRRSSLNRLGLGGSKGSDSRTGGLKTATEEERLGLVKGDSNAGLLPLVAQEYSDESDEWDLEGKRPLSPGRHPESADMREGAEKEGDEGGLPRYEGLGRGGGAGSGGGTGGGGAGGGGRGAGPAFI